MSTLATLCTSLLAGEVVPERFGLSFPGESPELLHEARRLLPEVLEALVLEGVCDPRPIRTLLKAAVSVPGDFVSDQRNRAYESAVVHMFCTLGVVGLVSDSQPSLLSIPSPSSCAFTQTLIELSPVALVDIGDPLYLGNDRLPELELPLLRHANVALMHRHTAAAIPLLRWLQVVGTARTLDFVRDATGYLLATSPNVEHRLSLLLLERRLSVATRGAAVRQ